MGMGLGMADDQQFPDSIASSVKFGNDKGRNCERIS